MTTDMNDIDTKRRLERRRFDVLMDCQRAAEMARRAIRVEARRLHDEEHVSWARIGAALGVSRQAAWERFGKNRA